MNKKSAILALAAFLVVIAAIGSTVRFSFEELDDERIVSIKEKSIEEANYWLNLARNSPEEVSSGVYKIILVREYAEKANVTLEELGTTEEELREIEKRSHIYLAKFFLNVSRKNSVSQSVEVEVSSVKEDAKKGGITLEELGTTDEELNNLTHQGYINEAKSLLITVREYVEIQPVILEISLIKENAGKAGMTLEEMGTSEEELKKLEEKNEYYTKTKNKNPTETRITNEGGEIISFPPFNFAKKNG